MSSGKRTLVIRADASAQIGTGHLMRCLALAQAWQDRGGEAVFITCCENPTLGQRLVAEGFNVVALPEIYPSSRDLTVTLDILNTYPKACLVLDGYLFDAKYHKLVIDNWPGKDPLLLVIDDGVHLDCRYADIIINPNYKAEKLQYISKPSAKCLLGSSYVLLRREFLFNNQHSLKKITDTQITVLVSFGGGVDNPVSQVLEALREINDLHITAVYGLQSLCYPKKSLYEANQTTNTIVRQVDYGNTITDLMKAADLAIIAAGGMLWELFYLGVPVLSYCRNKMQHDILEDLEELGAVVSLGYLGSFSKTSLIRAVTDSISYNKKRKQQITIARQLVDGLGVARICNVLSEGDR